MNLTRIEHHAVPRKDGSPLQAELRGSLAFELLIGLYALLTPTQQTDGWVPPLERCPARVRRAAAAVGTSSGELWLHLLGVPLESGASSADELVDAVAAVEPAELRRHIFGVHVPAWQSLVGAERLEAAAAGSQAAVDELLRHDRYYGGRAHESLELLARLSPAQTKRRVLAVLRSFATDVLAARARPVATAIGAEIAAQQPLVGRLDAPSLVSALARGYAYEPETEATRVVLVPHAAATPWLLLCQHRDARIICYPLGAGAAGEDALQEQTVELGRALSEPARVAILRRLTGGEASLGEVARIAGVAKSTAHHHLAQLRAAGLVEVRGNARAYVYALAPGGLDGAIELLRRLGVHDAAEAAE